MSDITLGCKYKDKITGVSGVATGITEYISGCNQALIQPKAKEDGSYVDSLWFDVQRLELVDDTVVSLDNSKTPGCDKSAPKR